MKLIQSIGILIFSIFLCICYPDYLLLEDLCHYIEKDDLHSRKEESLREWKDVMKIETEDIIISSKIYEYIRNYIDKNNI